MLLRPALAVPLSVVVLAGCAHSAPLTKESYLSRAERVCQQLEQQGQALPNPTGPADLPAYLKASTALTKSAQRDLVDLTRSYADRAYVEKIFLRPLQAQLDALRAVLPKVAVESAQGKTTTMDGLALPQADLQAMGVYGFHECRKVVGSA